MPDSEVPTDEYYDEDEPSWLYFASEDETPKRFWSLPIRGSVVMDLETFARLVD